MVYKQAPSTIMMVRPLHFGYNEQTASSNAFQNADGKENTKEIQATAQIEFDAFVSKLRAADIEVIVFDPDDDLPTTDEVFPNNWVSFHEDGKVIIYPMMAPNRRLERRMDFITALDKQYGFAISDIIDLSHHENKEHFLEGTGSLVLDYINKISYANTSPRTHAVLLTEVLELLDYENCQFKAVDYSGQDIYHTNVLMCLAHQFAVICLDCISNPSDKEKLRQRLTETGHEIVAISQNQMRQFAGNMMEVVNKAGESITVMSESAYNCLQDEQRKTIVKYSKILVIPIPTIEKFGGGSVRCMMAGMFLPRNELLKE